jgi:hypothetical protein
MQPMNSSASYLARIALGATAFAMSLVVFPGLALAPTVLPVTWPRWLGNALFFWPQYLLLPGGLRSESGAAPTGNSWLPAAATFFWLVAIAGYARLTLKWRKRWMLPMLFVGIAVLAEVALLTLKGAGWLPVLDGL